MPAAVLIALVLLSGVAAPSVEASFPGGNGELLITDEISGGGGYTSSDLIRVDAGSGETTRTLICNGGPVSSQPAPRCFSAGAPAASPDGRSVAFAVADRIPGPPFTEPFTYSLRTLSLATGAWSQVPLPGRALARGLTARWTPDLSFAVEARGRRVVLAGPDGSDRGSLVSNASQPDVSSTGWLAFVRRGNIWVRRPDGKERRLTRRRGSQPSWSPHGASVAFTRRGFVNVVAADGGRARRLTRGFDPAWSPDGRQIAFFRAVSDPEYFGQRATYLFTLNRRTGQVRRASAQVMAVPDALPPVGLDWQPIR
jgi:Tol biopolymer transport system component